MPQTEYPNTSGCKARKESSRRVYDGAYEDVSRVPPMFPFGRDLLAIYLQDHLAAATLGMELARRAASENVGTPLGRTLGTLAVEIADDRESLKSIMFAMGIAPDRLKNVVAWTGEKAGRLKLNGRLTSYSPLSGVLEIEWLIAGVSGKRALWRALRSLAREDARLQAAQLDDLIVRAERQLDSLWSAHMHVSRAGFADAD